MKTTWTIKTYILYTTYKVKRSSLDQKEEKKPGYFKKSKRTLKKYVLKVLKICLLYVKILV